MFWDFYLISNEKDYRKFIVSHTLALDINKIASLKSYVLRAFQRYQKHPNFPQKISFHFIEFSLNDRDHHQRKVELSGVFFLKIWKFLFVWVGSPMEKLSSQGSS